MHSYYPYDPQGFDPEIAAQEDRTQRAYQQPDAQNAVQLEKTQGAFGQGIYPQANPDTHPQANQNTYQQTNQAAYQQTNQGAYGQTNQGAYGQTNQGAYGQGNQGAFQQGVQGIDYTVDMVFCIDATGSMEDTAGREQRIINMVKQNALNFYGDFTNLMNGKGKHVRQLRIRIVAFRDYIADGANAMLVTDFFNLPQQAEAFEQCVQSIHAMGGGDIPEDGLEALAYAIRSNWTTEGAKKRQVIVVWTDAGTHPLGFGSRAANYPSGMPRDMTELSDWWDEYMHPNYKRLVIFAPDEEGWRYISQNWDNVVHYPSVAGNGLAERSYSDIMNVLGNSI